MERMAAAKMLRDALRRRFGEHLRQVLVFGSTARGTTRDDSDVDVLVVVDDGDNWRIARTVREEALAVEIETDKVFDLKTTSEAELATLAGRTPFMERVFLEGVAL